ncbi:SDR family NAD(P)-dependent oxidoreductase [Sporichthya polymorpha]|uniref:SDR family NAD(P)-dependent oxidoreductase n=1 Tax=Sporichthya polymorpha TaxID=35751 RepID=UPI00036A9D9D|nr:glucose 1-dehydrogenase [Sporichthya polymorpha]
MAAVTGELAGRVALVTGGTRGLGYEIARAYAAAGADVVVASRKPDACAAIAARLWEQTGRRVLGIPTHVGRWDECDRLVEAVYSEFGRCDVLVNNAGMSPLYDSVDTISEDLFDKVLAVNLKGPFRLASRIGARMVEAGRGSIINVSSVAAVQPSAAEVPYAMAKAGLNNMTTALARVFAPAVRVNTIMPGMFLTDISKAWDPAETAKRFAEDVPARRGGRPDEIVGAALYLASDASGYTTGSVLKIDGGYAWAAG